MKSGFYISYVNHTRFAPKKYVFSNRFFWTKFDLDELSELNYSTRFFSWNKFNVVSYYDRDHVYLGYPSTRENLQAFLIEQGVTERIRKIELVTNPRIFGYTFNPVSFYFIETYANSYIVIEIGNTFNEKKPYLVPPDCKDGDTWTFKTKKHFYISPFTSVENEMVFRIKRSENNLAINIDDFNKNGTLEVRASFTGKAIPWNNFNLMKLFFLYPLITFRIIASIHYHALKLYLKKIPYYKKTDDDHLQTDHYEWRDNTYRKKN